MTTVQERTRSMVEAHDFLIKLSVDRSVSEAVRWEAKQLLRHYPTAQEIWRAGRHEGIRQAEVARISEAPKHLPPVLAIWPLVEPFLCDSSEISNSALNPLPKSVDRLQAGSSLRQDVQILGRANLVRVDCHSPNHWCFSIRSEQILARAREVLGSDREAKYWYRSSVRGLDMRQPCSLITTAEGYRLIMALLARIEYGVYW